MKIEKVVLYNFKCFKGKFEFIPNEGLSIIVGDNEAGKSTIIEAIHLALSGWFHGRYLHNELTQHLFNYQVIQEYLASLGAGNPQTPPSIRIEVYISSDQLPIFEGNDNSERSNSVGFSLRIEFDDRYQDEYEALLASGSINTLPIEYYHYYWASFARDEKVTPRTIPIKSALIDSTGGRLQSGSDIYISRIVKDFLEPKEIVDISQAHRKMKETFMQEGAVTAINQKIQDASKISNKKVELSVELSSKNAWESSLVIYLDDIPFRHVGKGEQCIIKTKLALSHKKALEANLLLIEEPDNHLSHTRLNSLIKDIKEEGGDKQIIISTHNSFVANKLGLENLILLNDFKTARLTELTEDTYKFFEKLPGYDTLRLLLCKKAILVEGDADELVVQRAYADAHDGRLPIENEIDVIAVGGLKFLRFLEIAEKLNIDTVVITDTDGDLDALQDKYKNYLGDKKKPTITISYDETIDSGDLQIGKKQTPFNYNTLEPKLLKVNSVADLNEVFGTDFDNDDRMHTYMLWNKTECALKIFESEKALQYPDFITKAF